jgi:hypothetical protein
MLKMNQIQNRQIEQNLREDSEIFEDASSEIDEFDQKTKRPSRLSIRTNASEFSGSYQEIHSLFGNKLEINNLKKIQPNSEDVSESENIYVKELTNKNNGKKVFPIQAEAFFNFEKMLFDLVGLKHNVTDNTTNSIQPSPPVPQPHNITNTPSDQINREQDAKQIKDFFNNDNNVAFLNDMYTLKEMCEIKESEIVMKSDVKKEKEARLITVVLNHALRPRKAIRMLINRKAQINLDSFKNDISLNFKMDYSFIKKLFNLNGKEVKNSKF